MKSYEIDNKVCTHSGTSNNFYRKKKQPKHHFNSRNRIDDSDSGYESFSISSSILGSKTSSKLGDSEMEDS